MDWLALVGTSVVSIIASSGFWAYIQARQTKKDGSTKLLLGLAYDKIATLGVSYIERGWITRDEYEEFRLYLYDPYKDCGGNGVADRIMEEISHLPLRSYNRYSQIVSSAHRERTNHERNNAQDPAA